jgi:hypothetical protein
VAPFACVLSEVPSNKCRHLTAERPAVATGALCRRPLAGERQIVDMEQPCNPYFLKSPLRVVFSKAPRVVGKCFLPTAPDK